MADDSVPVLPGRPSCEAGQLAQTGDDHPIAEWQPVPPQDLYWLEFQERVPEASMAACMRGAEATLKLVAFLIPTYAAVATYAKVSVRTCAPLLWVLSALCSLVVLVPADWQFQANNVANIKSNFGKLIESKRRWTITSVVFALIGVFAAFIWPGLS